MAATDRPFLAREDDSNPKSKASQLRFHIGALDQHIAALEFQMATLREEREKVLEDLFAIVYPVLTLPNEITFEIFLQYVDKPHDKTSYPRNSPMRLASVCRSWRALALSTCSLWTHLRSGYPGTSHPEDTDSKRPHAANLLQLWLPRAGMLPVDLHLQVPASPTPESDAILRALGQFSSRWASLELNSNGPICFPTDVRGLFSSLARLSLCVHPSSGGITVIPNFLDSPHLRDLSLVAVSVQDWKTSIPWSQLTHLELFYQNPHDCLEMFARSPNLEVVVFASSEDPDPLPFPAASQIITLPRLHTLHLGSDCSYEILAYLVLPALNHLHMDCISDCVEQVQSLVPRSRCSPQALELSLYEPELELLLSCMSSLPTLRELRISWLIAPNDILTSLFSFIAEDISVLPALESIHIDECRVDIQLAPLVELLAARTTPTEGVALLKAVGLAFGKGEDDYGLRWQWDQAIERAWDKLLNLRSRGLNVDIQSSVNCLGDTVNIEMIKKLSQAGST